MRGAGTHRPHIMLVPRGDGSALKYSDDPAKPVQLAPDGRVKVLDFGLAKLVDPSGDDSGPALSPSPPVTGMTAPHVILGLREGLSSSTLEDQVSSSLREERTRSASNPRTPRSL